MARPSLQGIHGYLPGRTAARRLASDWPVYVAFLPSVVIGIAAAVDFGAPDSCPESRPSSASAKSTPGDADDYVEGLARRGIARIPD